MRVKCFVTGPLGIFNYKVVLTMNLPLLTFDR